MVVLLDGLVFALVGGLLIPDVAGQLREQSLPLAFSYLAYIEDGRGFIDLSRYLNEQGFRTTRGRAWRQDTLLKFMDSGFAAGYLQVRDACDCPKSRASACRHWRRFRGAHDAVINFDLPNRVDSEEMWEAYQERRKALAKMPPRERSASYDTTGLVRCVRCRGAMSGRPKPGAVYWRCAKSDAGGDCEGTTATHSDVLAEIRRFLVKVANGVDEAPGSSIVAPPQAEDAGPVEDRRALTLDLARWDAALTRLVTDYALHPDRYPAQAYDEARRNLERDRNAVAEKLDGIREKEEQAKPKLEDFRPLVVGLLPEWDTFSTVERNLFLRKLIRHILVSPRPSRFETRARIVPVWEDERTVWHANTATTGKALPGVSIKHEPTAQSEDMLDGIGWSIA
ncbi:recombinase family protein [Streptomyces niveus]|uniref:recombinase family protein n=1 Tax=Streptomyces niveus TaxID=193462 RepID=UPI0036C8C87B